MDPVERKFADSFDADLYALICKAHRGLQPGWRDVGAMLATMRRAMVFPLMHPDDRELDRMMIAAIEAAPRVESC